MDPLCRAVHDRPDPSCRCNEYAKVRNHERQQLRKAAEVAYRKATPTRQGRMSAEQKARVVGAHDFLIFMTSEIDNEEKP